MTQYAETYQPINKAAQTISEEVDEVGFMEARTRILEEFGYRVRMLSDHQMNSLIKKLTGEKIADLFSDSNTIPSEEFGGNHRAPSL